MTATCSPMIGQFFDTMISSSPIQSGYNDPSNSKSWKVLETVSSHLKTAEFTKQLKLSWGLILEVYKDHARESVHIKHITITIQTDGYKKDSFYSFTAV